ncbi:MAG: RDD family protein [Anaerolineales bacterium]|nr:RDD family protein [Anaerolineales bacterium]
MPDTRPAYAGLWPRTVAFALDYLVIATYLIVLVGLGLLGQHFAPSLAAAIFGGPLSGEAAGLLLVTLPVTLYFALNESGPCQATWGKQRRGLRLQTLKGERLGLGRALGRTALKFVPWELAHACIWQMSFAGPAPSPLVVLGFALVWLLVGANALSVVVSRQRQALYDWLAGTVVVRG